MDPGYMYAASGTDWFSIINTILTIVFGSGFILSMLTVKAQKKTANATAKQAEASAKSTDALAESTEIDNVDKVAKMWREFAEASELRYQTSIKSMLDEMTGMRKSMNDMDVTIKKLTATNAQILRIVKEITHDNLDEKKQEAKKYDAT